MTETVFDFLFAEGRLPRIGDEVPPWQYKGWLLPYIQGHEAERYGREAEPVFLNSGQGLLFGSAEDFARRK